MQRESNGQDTESLAQIISSGSPLNAFHASSSSASHSQSGHLSHLIHTVPVQAKVSLDKANDRYEREADHVAQKVMTSPSAMLQRADEEEKEEPVQTKLQTKPLIQCQEMVQARFGWVAEKKGWRNRVRKARTSRTEMKLLNEIINRIYPDIKSRFRRLHFPIRPYKKNKERDGWIYYDPALNKPGETLQNTVIISPGRTRVVHFIRLGSKALSEGTPKFSEMVLYHEYVHYLQHKGRMHHTLLVGARSQRVAHTHREALAFAEAFRHYFGQLQWEGAGKPPEEAIQALEFINRRFYEPSNNRVRAKVLKLVTSVVAPPNRAGKLRFLRKLATSLSIPRMSGRSIFRQHLLKAINRL